MKKKIAVCLALASLLCLTSMNVWAASGNNARPTAPAPSESTSSRPASTPASTPAPAAPSAEEAKAASETATVSDAIGKMAQNGTAVVETTTPINSAQLRAVAEKGGRLVVFSPNVSWHFNGLTNPDAELNPVVEVNPGIPAINSKLNGVPATVLRFMHNGTLPGTAAVAVNVSYAPGTTLYFYYHNGATGQFEFQQTTRVEAGGYAVVSLTHCSDYVLTTTPLTTNVAGGAAPAGTPNAARLDTTPHTGI